MPRKQLKLKDPVVEQGNFVPRPDLCPVPGKNYNLLGSKWIYIRGWRFKFGRPVIVNTKPKKDEKTGEEKPGKSWLSFTIYAESPGIQARDGKKPDVFSVILRSARIHHGRLQPAIAPWGYGKWYTVWMLGRGFAMMVYEAAKQWKLVADNPEFTVDGTKDPIGTLAYSKKTAMFAMSPLDREEKSYRNKLEHWKKDYGQGGLFASTDNPFGDGPPPQPEQPKFDDFFEPGGIEIVDLPVDADANLVAEEDADESAE